MDALRHALRFPMVKVYGPHSGCLVTILTKLVGRPAARSTLWRISGRSRPRYTGLFMGQGIKERELGLRLLFPIIGTFQPIIMFFQLIGIQILSNSMQTASYTKRELPIIFLQGRNGYSIIPSTSF